MSRFFWNVAFVGTLAFTGTLAGQAQAQFDGAGGAPFTGQGFTPSTQNGAPVQQWTSSVQNGLPPQSGTPTQNAAPTQNGAQGAMLTLPPNVKKVLAIDAHNMLLAEVDNGHGGTDVVEMKVDHSYAGGIAKTFGGSVVPTLPFVTPGFYGGFGGGNNSFGGGGNSQAFNNNSFGTSGVFNGIAPGTGFFPGEGNNAGPNTTVTGTGIFAPQARVRK